MIEDTNLLIQCVLSGNTKAQEEFFNKYKKVVENYLKQNKFKVPSGDFDDYTSEILIKVFYNLDKYDREKSGFKTWLMTVAKNYMIDQYRSNISTHCCNIATSNNCYCASNSSGMDLSVSYNTDFESSSSVAYLSSQLSPEDYTLLSMKYVQGYDYNEIGSEFNLTSTTVSNRVNYIKTKLKKNNSKEIHEGN
jgi:RNA polymerase sigma factor (sigma-70 family)